MHNLEQAQSNRRRVTKKVGKPRLDGYEKLIKRFYEPLVLLNALGRTRGMHMIREPDESRRGILRQFRNDIAFLCEYDKGGHACTAIGIEDREGFLVYWFAANKNGASTIMPFLQRLLPTLRNMRAMEFSERQVETQRLTNDCMAYAMSKIRKLTKLFQRHAQQCIVRLDVPNATLKERTLRGWLNGLSLVEDPSTLCRRAYEERRSDLMKELDAKSQSPMYQNVNSGRQSCFSEARHYIGRLADHIRVPQRLVDALPQANDLLVRFGHVEQVPPFQSVKAPERDGQTHLQGICKRMCSGADMDRFEAMLQKLEFLDTKFQVMKRILECYDDPNFKPRVHAEIQVLEHFYNRNLQWADGDRFVGCSKDACYCCHLYFRYHPAGPVVPPSHQNVWPSWGPPLLKNGARDPNYFHQRDILNSMVREIRKDAFQQIDELRNPMQQHPDSLTAITSTAANPADEETLFDDGTSVSESSVETGSLTSDSHPSATDFTIGGKF